MDAQNVRTPLVRETVRFYESRTPLLPVNQNVPLTSPGTIQVAGSRMFWISKRALDVCVSLCALPFVGVGALVLKFLNPLFNPGPVFYTQFRIGRLGKPFLIRKFRTMTQETEADGITAPDDQRITRLGAILRKFRLDELPQMLNVLSGEMSLIGPRPEMIEIAERYSIVMPGFPLRHIVRPGISGLSQVTVGYTACDQSYAHKLQRDLEYIRSAGWPMEARIFARTIWVVATGFGAR